MDYGRFLKSLSFLLIASTVAFEAEARLDKIPGSRYTSGRGAAMGDAFIPFTEDGASALFYNPAGIALLRKTHFEPLNLQIQMNQHYLNQFSLNFFNAMSLSGYQSTLADNQLTSPSVGLSLFPNFFVRGLAFGVLIQNKVMATQQGTTINYRSLYQLIPTIGFGVKLAKGIVRIGYSLQWVNQSSGELSALSTDSDLGYTNGLSSGSAFSHTLGLGFTFPVRFLPSINVVARNLLGANFIDLNLAGSFASNSPGRPPDEPMSLDVSFSMSPKFSGTSVLNFSAVMRDMTNTSGFGLLRRAAFGLELGIRRAFFIRMGYGSGYPSAGVGIKSSSAEFHLSWWSEEIGTPGLLNRDIRTMIQYQFRLF